MYQALYRKYRPQTFDDVVGQEHITRTLKSQVMQDRLSHAYLFTGTRGTGKTSCAKILAKAVNCMHPVDGSPCNSCAACRSIDSGACLDVLEIDAASNNGVDNVRVLRDDAVYSPSEVKRRVYIIDEVHMLSMAAFNALLKIVEEPPEHLIFILATTELHKVPATILSRCQRFSFRRLLPEDIAGRLNFAAYQEKIEIEPEAIRLLARLADGALRDGLSLLDQCASGTAGTITTQSVYQCLGLAGEKRTAQLLKAVAARQPADALAQFTQLYAGGKDLAAMLDELCMAARDLLILKTAPKSGTGMLSGVAMEQELEELLPQLSVGELMRIVSILQTTLAGLKNSVNSRIAAELCLIELCSPEASLDAASLNARLGRVEQMLAGGMVNLAPNVHQPEQPDEEDLPPWELGAEENRPASMEERLPNQSTPQTIAPAGFWADLLERIRPELSARVRGFYAVNGPVRPKLEADNLFLVADNDFVRKIAGEPTTLKVIGEKASAILGRSIQVKMILQSDQETDKLQKLLEFGEVHKDIVTIN